MSAGDTHPARRVQVPASGDINDVMWDINDVMWDLRPGDYCGPIDGNTGGKVAVFFRLPSHDGLSTHVGGIRHVVSPPHVFTEQSDGSLEIRESLGCDLRPGGGYMGHGFLDAGYVWREV